MTFIARIVVQGLTADVHSPFEMKDILRSMPDRQWDKKRKCWVIGTTFVDMCADALRQGGCTVYVTTHTGQPWTSGQQRARHGHRATPAPDWVNQAFNAVAPANVPHLRRGLLAAFHPDRDGGDLELSRQINAAADRREKEIK